MKVWIASDIHNKFGRFMPSQDVELILIAGDVTNFGQRDYKNLVKAKRWLNALGNIAPTYLVPGNHDIGCTTFEHYYSFNSTNLLHKCLQTKFGKIAGMSLSPCYSAPHLAKHWDFMTRNKQAEELYYSQEVFAGADIVISHSPPASKTGYSPAWGQIGSQGLLDYILLNQPKLVICGHVHESAGQETIGKTLVINTACKSQVVDIKL